METFCFTFGSEHFHPQTREPMCDYWVEIVASSSEAAREAMIQMFGLKWSHQYHEKSFTKHCKFFPKGCYSKHEID